MNVLTVSDTREKISNNSDSSSELEINFIYYSFLHQSKLAPIFRQQEQLHTGLRCCCGQELWGGAQKTGDGTARSPVSFGAPGMGVARMARPISGGG
jgi:hypothetical protein